MYFKYKVWGSTFFITNFTAIIMFIISINNDSSKLSFYSGIYSIYIILLQYYINYYKYKELFNLATKNEQLVENRIYELKELYRSDLDNKYKENKYMSIMSNYLKDLEFYPNHSDLDVYLEKILKNTKKSTVRINVEYWLLMILNNIYPILNLLLSITVVLYILG